jgi:methylmalonyl-CoA mutase
MKELDLEQSLRAFEGTSEEEWKHLIIKGIKAETEPDRVEFYHKLTRELQPGVLQRPFYTQESVQELAYLQGFHSLWVQTRQRVGWMNAVPVIPSPQAPLSIRTALENGVDALWLGPLSSDAFFEPLLEGLSLSRIPVFFHGPEADFVPALLDYLSSLKGENPAHRMGGIVLSPEALENPEGLAAISHFFKDSPYFNPFLIWIPAGPESLTQALKLGTHLANSLTERGVSVRQVLSQTAFSLESGNHFFLEIARLRALRLLWWQIGQAYDPGLNLADVLLHVRTQSGLPPEKEPYQNLLSNTIQALAAVLGGCDALTVVPHDALQGVDAFSKRIARNVSLLFREEAYLDKVTDPAAGTYLVESLTHQLALQAWNDFTQTA